MNRDKIVEIATALPREAYIDLLCAGVENICDYSCYELDDLHVLARWKNLSLNQSNALIEAYREQGKEEEHE